MYHLRLLFPISILFYFNVSTLSAMSFGEFLNIKSSTFYQTSMDKTDQNWRFVSSDDFSKIYLKEDSKKINEDIINFEALTDYIDTSPQWDSFSKKANGLSEIENVSFDCAHKKYRSLGGSWFEGHLAKGLIKSTYTETENWSAIPKFYQKLYEMVCAQPFEHNHEKP